MQPLWLRAKGAFYPETQTRKAALFDVVNPGYIAGWIDQPTALGYFKVHMITAGAATTTDLGDGLTTLHQITDLHDILFIVRIERGVAIGMTDLNHIAIARLDPGKAHHSSGDSDHITAGFGGKIDAFMPGVAPG